MVFRLFHNKIGAELTCLAPVLRDRNGRRTFIFLPFQKSTPRHNAASSTRSSDKYFQHCQSVVRLSLSDLKNGDTLITSREESEQNRIVLCSVDFWCRKCVLDPFAQRWARRNSGRDIFHALSAPEIYTTKNILSNFAKSFPLLLFLP